jgi:hypothetical protein
VLYDFRKGNYQRIDQRQENHAHNKVEFQKTWPKRDVPGLKEEVAKLEQIGLNNLIVLNQKQIIADSNSTASLDPKGGHSSLEATGTHSFHSNDDVPKSEADLSSSSWPWWFID